ncbi:hypothetical protein [Streptococcus uberis]|uniref:hypothetical protein n=1 Tax=Streptococcus uberis TaxID=1349 RepID=UPI00378D48B8
MKIGFFDLNIRDRAIILTKKNQVFQGVVYDIQENTYFIALNYKKGGIQTSNIILHESEIEYFEIIEYDAIERGENPMN